MFKKIINFIVKPKARLWKDLNLAKIIFSLLVLLPVIFSGFLSYIEFKSVLTKNILSKRESLAYLSSLQIEEKFDHIISIGLLVSNTPNVIKSIKEEKWQEALDQVSVNQPILPFVDIMTLVDTKGIVHVVNKESAKGAIGVDYSYRDWYRGVAKKWEPYISEVFKISIPPYSNSIVISIPIKDQNIPIAIFTMQIPLENLTHWAKEIDVGPGGFTYFVDHNGQIASHPNYDLQSEIIDFSKTPAVKMVLNGQSGVDITYNQIDNEERVSAYFPVNNYNWGVVVAQPTKLAFAERNKELTKIIFRCVLILILNILLLYLMLKILRLIFDYHKKEEILLKSIGDGVVAIDRFWNIVLWNKAAGDISGWKEEEVMGKPVRNFLKFVKEVDRQENIAFIEKAMLSGEVGFMENHTFLVTKDGKDIPVGDSAAPVFDEKGIVIGAIIIFRNTTKEKESQALKSDFAYASHQLNTPVTKALWNIEAAIDDNDCLDIKDKLATAYQSMKSTQKLVGQLHTVSMIDQKNIVAVFENIKLTDLFEEVIKSLKEKSDKFKIDIKIEGISYLAEIKTDHKLLKQIFIELLDNALIYNNTGGQVSVKVSSDDSKTNIIFSIEDNGIGINEDQKSLAFTKFFRGNNFDTTEIVGAGLGLFICKEYIKLLSGKIWFESVKGKTVFYVSLPLVS